MAGGGGGGRTGRETASVLDVLGTNSVSFVKREPPDIDDESSTTAMRLGDHATDRGRGS